jgi:hypothetical protein
VRLAGDGPCQQRLAGAWRADQQHAARDRPAEPLVLGRVLEEVNHLDQLGLDLVDAGDIGEGDRRVAGDGGVVAFGAAAAHPQHAAGPAERLAG